MVKNKFWKSILSMVAVLGLVLQVGNAMPVQASQKNTDISGDIEVIFNVADDVMKPYIADFCQKYPKVNVTYTCYTSFETQIPDRIASGDYGDVLFVPAYMTVNDLSKYFAYLGDYVSLSEKYNYLEGGRKVNNSIYGIPSLAYMSGILYNKDVFYQAGVTQMPTTPEDFLQVLQDIEERTDAIPFYTNYAAPWALALWDTFSYIEMTGNADYKYRYFTYEKDAYLEGSTHYQSFRLLYDIVDKGFCESDPAKSDWEKCKGMLNEGKIGCLAIGSWAISQFKGAGENGDAIAFMPFPYEIEGRQYMTVSTDYCYGVSKNSEHPEAARAFLDFMLDESGYALAQETLSIVKTDPYPDAYGDMENVILLTNGTATGSEYTHRNKLLGKLSLEDGYEAQRVIDSALGNSEESFDDIMEDWNRRWESGRTADMKLVERDLKVGTGTSILQNYVVNFSQTEKDFLENTGKLKVGYLTNLAPFQYQKDGEFAGVTRDMCEAVAENTGLEMEYVPYENTQAMVDGLKAGEIDMIAGMDKGVGYDESLRYSKDYFSYMNLLVKNDTVDAQLGVGSRLAAVKGENNSFSETVGIVTKRYNTYAEALRAVESLDADYVVMNYYSADYYMKAQECSHVAMLPLSEMAGLYFAFSENVDTRLISICNKCIYGIPQENIQVMLREHLDPPAQAITFMRFVEANPVGCIVAVCVFFLFIATVAVAFFREKMKSAKKHAMDVTRYEILASIVNEYLFEIDYVKNIIWFDKKCEENFGFKKEVSLQDDMQADIGVDTVYKYCNLIEDSEGGESPAFLLTDKQGASQWYKVLAHKVKNSDGKPQHIIAKLVNIQKEMEEKQRIAEKAETDPLTGLFNRDGFRSRMTAFYENPQGQLPIALVMVDFDDFKSVNDTLGHAGGDVALKMLAGNMKGLFAENAVNCRYGGDEFMIFTYGIEENQLGEMLGNLVSRMNHQLSFQSANKNISISVGAVYSYETVSHEELFEQADQVLYQVKEKGKNQYMLKPLTKA